MFEIEELVKNCYNCGVELRLGDFLNTNKELFPEAFLKAAFKGKLIQLYCCTCYQTKMNGEERLSEFVRSPPGPYPDMMEDEYWDCSDPWEV